MAKHSRTKKAPKGSVQFKNSKGWLQLVFSYPIKVKGVVKMERFYISTGYEDTPVNRYRVGDIVKELQGDIDYGEVNLTLQKYQTEAVKAKVARTPAEVLTAPNASASFAYDLGELWAQYTEFKRDLIIQVFMDNQYYRFYADFIRFLFFTGARPSEAIALQWKHMMSHAVKFERAVMVSEEGLVCKEGLKTQAKRLFPINPQLMGILKSIRQQAVSTDEMR